MQPTLAFATQLAIETGELLRQYFDPAGTSAQIKADSSVVTEADLAADRLISRKIRAEFPGDVILSEELHADLEGPAEALWIVDPLDGTTNFSLGLPLWGLSIARIVNGRPKLAVLHFPLIEELYHAQHEGGAFLNGDEIHTRPFNPKLPGAFFSCCSRTHRRYRVRIPYKTRILGSAAYSFCAVARGSALLAFEATPKIWDIAGGWLLVQEAGGAVGTYDGENPFPLKMGLEFAKLDLPTIAAATPEEMERGRRRIRPRETQGMPAQSPTTPPTQKT